MNHVEGCKIKSLNNDACSDVLDSIRRKVINKYEDLHWLLAHCDDGVTWGRWDDQGQCWQTAFEAYPHLSPEISAKNLMELRLFGPKAELMIWRTSLGFSGRFLQDGLPAEEDILSPVDEQRLLLGDRLLEQPRNGFSRLGSSTGAEQVVPLRLTNNLRTLRLSVRQYLQQDQKTGVVRIAVTRLVDLKW